MRDHSRQACRKSAPWLPLATAAVVAALALVAVAPPARAKLGSKEYKAALNRLNKAYADENTTGIATAIRELSLDDSDRAVKVVAKVVGKFWDSQEVYQAARDFTGALTDVKALKKLRNTALRDKAWQTRVLFIDAFGEVRGESEVETLAKAARDKDSRVGRAAVRQLGKLSTKTSITALIEVMEWMDESERQDTVWQDARNALTMALGVQLDMGMDYRNYFEARQEEFVEGQGLRGDGDPYEGAGSASGGTVTLFGQPILCKKVVLILDRSGSMVLADPYPAGWRPGPSSTMGRDEENSFDEHAWVKDPERKRMNRAKKELIKVARELSKAKAKVNVCVYSSDVDFWKPEGGLHDLNGKNLESLIKFIEELEPEGVTATDLAMLSSFERVEDADCFYLISDGFATRDGENKIPTADILSEVAEANRFKKVQINTFGFEGNSGNPKDGADRELMEGLCRSTGGTYTEIP